MDDSIPHPLRASRPMELPAWKSLICHIAAVILCITFVTAGVWKITDPFGWATMVEQLRVPASVSLPLTLLLAVGETFAGVMILVPRFRRWGAWLVGLLLAIFLIYIGANYSALLGKECSCFPWVKRTIGPGFLIGDSLMIVGAILAGLWARRPAGLRSAGIVLGAIVVFAGVSYGVNSARLSGTKAPDTITVDGKPYSLQHGRIFLFFYDPECSHCDQAARHMAKLHWIDTTIIAIPTRQPQFAGAFLHDTGLKALTSYDLTPLKKTFPFGDPPFGVALERGREKGPVTHYDPPEPEPSLRKLGYIQ